MLLIGEGTAEIQKMIIGRRLLEDYSPQALSSCLAQSSRRNSRAEQVCRVAGPHGQPQVACGCRPAGSQRALTHWWP